MTIAPSASSTLRMSTNPLGGADVRRGLEAHLRRRVPSQEVEDIAQSVFAAAVASPSIPSDPDELRRWLAGIARHKIADFHRGRARSQTLIADGSSPEAVAVSPAAFEERDVLRALLGEKRSEREARAMEWLLREHAGERLADIASEQGMPAPVVRQRVSRLRRVLRSRWSVVAGIAAVVGAWCLFGLSRPDATEAILGDPSARIAAGAAPVSIAGAPTELAKAAEGEWIVRAVRPNRALSAVEQQLVDMEAMSALLRVHGNRIDLTSHSGAFKTSWRVSRSQKLAHGARLTLLNDNGSVATAEVVFGRDESGERLDVALHDPRYGGTVTLRRPAR